MASENEMEDTAEEFARQQSFEEVDDSILPPYPVESEQGYADYVRRQIEISLRQIENGEGISHEEAKRRMAKWLN